MCSKGQSTSLEACFAGDVTGRLCSASCEGDKSKLELCHKDFTVDEQQSDGSFVDRWKCKNFRENVLLTHRNLKCVTKPITCLISAQTPPVRQGARVVSQFNPPQTAFPLVRLPSNTLKWQHWGRLRVMIYLSSTICEYLFHKLSSRTIIPCLDFLLPVFDV